MFQVPSLAMVVGIWCSSASTSRQGVHSDSPTKQLQLGSHHPNLMGFPRISWLEPMRSDSDFELKVTMPNGNGPVKWKKKCFEPQIPMCWSSMVFTSAGPDDLRDLDNAFLTSYDVICWWNSVDEYMMVQVKTISYFTTFYNHNVLINI